MPLNPGTRLGPYEIQSAVGAGGMGEVYRARDTRLERDVAVKVLAGLAHDDPERLRRFEQEARAAAALNHPNILAVHDIGIHEGAPYIVSELLEGATLRAAIGTGLPVRKAVEYAVQIARGLAAAHEKGIVHRDLKPDNLFVTTAGHVKILDFGLAKLTEPAAALSGVSAAATMPGMPATEPGLVLGTMGYMAPEQLRGQAVDHRADLFSFGAVLYEMLSGQRAFAALTPADTVGAILDREPADLPVAERHIPPGLARIVERCLEKNPAARFQTAADLAFALEALSSSTASGAAVVPAVSGRGSLPGRSRVWLVAALACLVTLLAAVPATLYLGRAAPDAPVTRLDVVTNATSEPFSFAMSPDGRNLVFVANGDMGSQLWLRPLDQATSQPLTGTLGATYPFWAPDSRALAFFADGKLKRLDVSSGGAIQVLANASAGRGGTWSADGVIVFAPTASSVLMRVPATGGSPTAVTRLGAGQGSHRWPQFLPDGRVLFSSALGQAQTRGVYVTSLEGGEPVRMTTNDTAAHAQSGRLLRVIGSALVAQELNGSSVAGDAISVAQGVGSDPVTYQAAFSMSASALAYRSGAAASRRQLVWTDRSGKVLGAVGRPDDAGLANPSLAPDGRRIAIARNADGNADLWLLDIDRGVPSRLTFDDGVDTQPTWSSDGSRIVFRSGRNGVYNLFEKPANGAGEERPLLVTPQNKAPLDWSRDGRFLLYASEDAKTGSDLWALPLTGDRPSTSSGRPEPVEGRKPVPVVQTGFEEMQGQFSPDGRWVAYASNESGRFEIYVRQFPDAGGKWQVSTGGGIQPRWGTKGQEILYLGTDSRLVATPVRANASGALDVGAPVSLFQTHMATGSNILPAGYGAALQYAVAADGRLLMNVSADDAPTTPITIVLNWTALLPK